MHTHEPSPLSDGSRATGHGARKAATVGGRARTFPSVRLLFGMLCLAAAAAVHRHDHAAADGHWQTTFDAHVHAGKVFPSEVWIDANFKRPQLAMISAGQVARVKVNGLSALFDATVDSIRESPEAGGSVGSPDYTTPDVPLQSERHWVKVTLRAAQPGEDQLISGMSAIVSVRTDASDSDRRPTSSR